MWRQFFMVCACILANQNYSLAENGILNVNDNKNISNTYHKYTISENDEKESETFNDHLCDSLQPSAPNNGFIICEFSRKCKVTCKIGYRFPQGEHELKIECEEHKWKVQKTNYRTIPQCEPACSPKCENNGICEFPNQCKCTDNFDGSRCQREKKPCSDVPNLVANARQDCNNDTCTITCLDNFIFPDDSKQTFVKCKNGKWVSSEGNWTNNTVPDCQLNCKLNCQNGGICLPSNECECPKGFLGPQCQYHEEICSSVKLGFNGITDCQVTNETNECKLACPTGTRIEFPAAKTYVCRLSIGSFEPQQVPQCISISAEIKTRNEKQAIIKKPEYGTCFTWAGSHYKTFDGKIYSFESSCMYVLLKETEDDLFSMSIQNTCRSSSSNHCSRQIRIFVQGQEYVLSNGFGDNPELRSGTNKISLPAQFPSMRIKQKGKFIKASLDAIGLKIKWDGNALVQVDATESLWNRTAGLCGSFDGNRNNDFGTDVSIESFVKDWKLENFGEKCVEEEIKKDICESDTNQKAEEFCGKLINDDKYKQCTDASEFESACRRDYCTCEHIDRGKCACDTLLAFVKHCARKGLVSTIGWRNQKVCPMECTNGKVYMTCQPSTQAFCGDAEQFTSSGSCEEGCYCPEGLVLENGSCIKPEECPCQLRGKDFEPGARLPADCNTCTCIRGSWNCTKIECSGKCSAIGDPHYTTFDGKRFNFMGKCTYYLVKGENYSVETDNSACAKMGFGLADNNDEQSCTKIVTIRTVNSVIKLKKNREILINEEGARKLPIVSGGATVRVTSSLFVSVELFNGLEVLWDGASRVYVHAPASLRGKTKGLCGTFTSNQKEDFLTPDGDVENSIVVFANKWKTDERCENVESTVDHPCDANPQKRSAAEQHCSILKKKLFEDCHWHVDPDPFYKDCLYDMCQCVNNVESCLCPTLATYAKECSDLGVLIPWRKEVLECQVLCPADQEYQICGNSCTRSCADISFRQDCKNKCVEGCNCPTGQTLNDQGNCIPIVKCPCSHNGMEFEAGYREVRQKVEAPELCTCAGGLWNCRPALEAEVHDYPELSKLKTQCKAELHQELSTCEPVKPRTCRHKHRHLEQSPSTCRPGCVCQAGYVLDVTSGLCVQESDCPCYHGGHSHQEGATIRADCNTCVCNSGQWNCTKNECFGVCSVWGDSHFTTFDDRHYDFQGTCDYVLAKGRLSDVESFVISIRNVACGTTGVTCSKSIAIAVGKNARSNEESIVLVRGKNLTFENTNHLERIAVRRAGLFMFLDVPDLGIVIQWDEGTRIYIRVDPKWKGKTRGLCGDFNDNAEDDFKTPSGGVPEVSARLFGDSWKLSEYCAKPPKDLPNTRAKHPERELWAIQRCRILKSEIFKPCHSELPPDEFIDRCVYDACGCDTGGDCECLCTAIAAYAHKCSARGIDVQWRNQKLCPMQCDIQCSSYTPCMSTCPLEACDNLVTQSSTLCEMDTCIEGCQPIKCPEGQIYLNSSYTECIPREKCRPFCKVVDGVTYTEGEKVKSDECHSCFCTRGQIVCKGRPCANDTIEILVDNSEIHQIEENVTQCISGWSEWLNINKENTNQLEDDNKRIPLTEKIMKIYDLPTCLKNQMTKIECRTVNTHVPYTEVGSKISCDLDNGFICNSDDKNCPDFEFRVYCECISAPIIGENCDPKKDSQVDRDNCREYFECAEAVDGYRWVKNGCSWDMLYNEDLQKCDRAEEVIHVTPTCGRNKTNDDNTEFDFRIFTPKPEKKASECYDNEVWNECAIRCSKTCEYFKYSLTKLNLCSKTVDCVPGCVPKNQTECTFGLWRDRSTCVDSSHCLCKSNNGRPILPGTVVRESNCKICQCINNYYTCDDSACEESALGEPVVIPEPIKEQDPVDTTIVPSTSTPPRKCTDGKNYTWLIEENPFDVRFNASSFASTAAMPSSIRLHRTQAYFTWQPEDDNTWQWAEVRLKKSQPIYGIIIGGDVDEDKFVTSYRILFSEDGQLFSYYKENGMPKLFPGPVDSSQRVRVIFEEPIEAKVIRVNPMRWHNRIAMQLELVGCGVEKEKIFYQIGVLSLSLITEIYAKPICDDPMGYDNNSMSDQQILVSSTHDNSFPNLRLSSPTIWRPAFDNLDQYVQFDFLEPRNITGIETMGGNNTWTTAYKIKYSKNGKNWNTLIDKTSGEREFLGNVDDVSSKINYFNKPVSAKLLKIYPTKWNGHIGLKIEIHGCFLPYPIVELPPKPLPQKIDCNICNGVSFQNMEICKCNESLWWDGKTCVMKHLCPCSVEGWTYSVGSSYQNGNCDECTCTLGGISSCQPKSCPVCQSGLRPVVTELCKCLCMPCPAGQRLCPSSNDCIDDSKWCDGVQDCSDDEVECTVLATTKVVKQTIIKVECQSKCPPGFEMVPTNSSSTADEDYNFVIRQSETYKKSMTIKMKLPIPMLSSRFAEADDEQCPKFICKLKLQTSGGCQQVTCPEGFQPRVDQSKNRQRSSSCSDECIPIPITKKVCTLTGRTFVTFDGVEYKYDICDHLVARSLRDNRWYIIVEKLCDIMDLLCHRSVVVGSENHEITLHQDMYATVDDNTYKVDEMIHLGNKNPDLIVNRVGNALRVESQKNQFWVILESDGSVKVGISENLINEVDGLCGYMDGLADNDLQSPDGNITDSIQEFGDTWRVSNSSECKLQTCSEETQQQAWQICSVIQGSSFAACGNALNRESFATTCLESTCLCLSQVEHNQTYTYDECRCRALESFVRNCYASDLNVDLSAWRTIHDCPVVCEEPFVHQDCYRKKCEMSCENLNQPDPCPIVKDHCVSGCFCPEGTVRSGNTCVSPAKCRDCICNVLGDSKYISFDRNNFIFSGNCSYVLSRGVLNVEAEIYEPKYAYEVLITNGWCGEHICTEVVTVLYKNYIVQIRRNGNSSSYKLISSIRNKEVESYPFNNSWLNLQKTLSHDIKLEITPLQLEVIVYKHNLAVTVRLPSYIFSDMMEGICGNCDGNPKNDIKLDNGIIIEDSQEFGENWRLKRTHKNLQLGNDQCENKHKLKQYAVTNDTRCEQLLLNPAFTRCHNLVDPIPYYKSCKESLLLRGDVCVNLEAYARICSSAGICVDWRTSDFCPMNCSEDLEYRPCESGCPLTCESLASSSKCSAGLIEGCFCLGDTFWHMNKCISKRHCLTCDDQGHVDGDVWQKDKCTTCSCKDKQVNCQTISCPAFTTICEQNSKPIPIIGTEDSCCPKYYCVPIRELSNSNTCVDDTQQPQCGFAQSLKITYDSNNCTKFICECVPEVDCPLYENDLNPVDEKLEPGFVRVTNTSGCCPRIMKLCQPETCPQNLNCPKYYRNIVTESPNTCCPKYDCEPPKDQCIYTNSNGDVALKNIGGSWTDGKCKRCSCEIVGGVVTPSCVTTVCIAKENHPDYRDYVLEIFYSNNECCPQFERIGCKADGQTYQIGQKWNSDINDLCVTSECTNETAVQKKTYVHDCQESCELGSEYQPSPNKSFSCCGKCVTAFCVLADGSLKSPGEIWYSSDFCITSTCISINDSLQVQAEKITCDNTDPTEEQNYKLLRQSLPKKCCPDIIRVACNNNGKYYNLGETWISSDDVCVTESCIQNEKGVLEKYKETQTCNTNCAKGWAYIQPNYDTCCGECKQTQCVGNETLYEPGQTWYSDDNCTVYSCIHQSDQLVVSSSFEICPDEQCSSEFIYKDGCCMKCKLPSYNVIADTACAAEVIDFEKTIGLLIEKKGVHGTCKNLEPIKGLTECQGHCSSSTHFNNITWQQDEDCKCCQPVNYRKIQVELTCEDGKRFKKKITVPAICSCENCQTNPDKVLSN